MLTLGEIADVIGAALPEGRRDLPVIGIGSPEEAAPGHVVFLLTEKLVRYLPTSKAAAVVVAPELAAAARDQLPQHAVLLEVADAPAAMQRALEHLARPAPRPAPGVDSSAIVHESARIGRDVAIGPGVVVGKHAALGNGTVLHAGVVIGDDASIGAGCELFVGVVVRERCTLGDRVIINANSVIGTDGFGYRWDGTRHAKLPHIGTVVIEDDVEIGSCTCVDRAKIGETRIGEGTKIDNLVQIAHNVRIGRHCVICGGTSVGGTAVLGNGVIIAGAVAIADHTIIHDGARAGGMAGVHGEVHAGATVIGIPAIQYHEWWRQQAALRRLPEALKTIRALSTRITELEKKLSQSGG